MQYHIKLNEDAQQSVRRIALKQIDLGIADIDNSELDRHEVVHRLRKRCKKQRALLRLVRACLEGDYRSENAFYRDLSRGLSALRDAQALLEAYGRIVDHFSDQISADDFSIIHRYLSDMLEEEVGHEGDLHATLAACSQELCRARERASNWSLKEDGFAAFEPGLIRTYRRGCRAMELAQEDRTSENLHDWRKRVKYHWYHSRLLRRMSPALIKPHRLMSSNLGSLLGQDHDLAVLKQRLADATQHFANQNAGQALEKFLVLVARRREQIQAEAFHMGQYLFAETPRQLVNRWRKYWDAWHASNDTSTAASRGLE